MKFWYKPKVSFLAALLWPLSLLYKKIVYRKYQKDLASLSKPNSLAHKLNIPVIVVGNLTVGGTGKTPMVRFLFRYLHVMGFKVGVISRGYGGNYKGVHHVQASDEPGLVGDEVAMQYAYCQRQGLDNIEFVVARQRIQAALKAQELGCNFIISDDGLQHYCLPRHLEIAVIGPLGLGNKLFIPAGPLREEVKRLRKVDFVINNSSDPKFGSYTMSYRYLGFLAVKDISTSRSPAFNLEQILSYWNDFLQQKSPQNLIIWQEYLKRHPAFISTLATRYEGCTYQSRQDYLAAQFNRPDQVLAFDSLQKDSAPTYAPNEGKVSEEKINPNSYNQVTAQTTAETAKSINKVADAELDPDDPLLLSKIEEHVHLLSKEQLNKIAHKMADKASDEEKEGNFFTEARHKLAHELNKMVGVEVHNQPAPFVNYAQELEATQDLDNKDEFAQAQEDEVKEAEQASQANGAQTHQATSVEASQATTTEAGQATSEEQAVDTSALVAKIDQLASQSVPNPTHDPIMDNFVGDAQELFTSVPKQQEVKEQLKNLVKQAKTNPETTSVTVKQAKVLEKVQQSLTSDQPNHFANSEEFLEFIDKQLDPGVLSYKYLLAKSRSLISTEHVLVECMQAVFPKVAALCAIGYPEGFRKTLTDMGFTVEHLFAFPDHYEFKQEDIDKLLNEHPELSEIPLMVTEKDAIKLQYLDLPPLTFFIEREGYFAEHTRWLESLKNRLISIYTSGVDN
ncbi:tetraacyldisaccharide 4'-kinase [Psittacicella melopsittaci]|uniref:Tetraacyldisaccharide 4'-kinase n=1 Tax=Psittacicella melopsittaci TaxID=2028576 RepID=A0A3A1YBJ0_9GAMM|nr:tetraacyldisaccharide 4'-kinase [Psittacicella melopsittaci]RIY33574.1 tetraacyldisaccharide 4'-kinase [Psittacicella melopsittaci]